MLNPQDAHDERWSRLGLSCLVFATLTIIATSCIEGLSDRTLIALVAGALCGSLLAKLGN